jgi:hypothetical protein
VQTHQTTVCQPDTNECTDDPACNPANGQCLHPNKPDSTPCTDNDNNACTTAGCDAGVCNQSHNTTVCQPDTNQCTDDLACNPANGQCLHPNKQDSTPCTDTDSNDCTGAGCEAGQCVQSHVELCKVLDHFMCYETKPTKFPVMPAIPVEDQFGAHSEIIRFPHRLCAPADKRDEFPDAPTHPDHLIGHIVTGKSVREPNLTIVNQFGTIKLDTIRPDLLLVPTLKTLAPPGPGPFPTGDLDHFQCYKVKRSKGSPKFQKITGVKVDDQFETVTVDIVKPYRLCAPANKKGEDPTAPQHIPHLLCYTTKTKTKYNGVEAFTNSQFGPDDLELIHRRELCVPSTKNPGSSTTTTAAPTTTTTSSTGPITTTTTSSTTTTTVMSPSGAFVDEPLDPRG